MFPREAELKGQFGKFHTSIIRKNVTLDTSSQSETTLCNVNRKWLESMEINPDIHLFVPEIKRVFSLFLCCCLFVCFCNNNGLWYYSDLHLEEIEK